METILFVSGSFNAIDAFFSIFYLIVQIGRGQFSLGSYLIAIVTAVIGITLLTMKKRIEIDREFFLYCQYIWFAVLEKGVFLNFDQVWGI